MTAARKMPLVWIIDCEQWPRACLRAELIARGYNAIGLEDAGDAVRILAQSGKNRPAAIVLELKGQLISNADLDFLAGTGIPVIFLGGAVEIDGLGMSRENQATVLQRPITLGRVADTLDGLVKHSR